MLECLKKVRLGGFELYDLTHDMADVRENLQ
jgi:hypothetical protein